ncbi:MAG TPA: hemolysin family protein [Bacteroidales bacterium]|jgi:CBS domain containing-hemolysin-like protein|nr:hemolysin family protein [Bacteroidales bacterium]
MNSIAVILTAMVSSAFFSGMEIAFITANKVRIELDIKQGAFGSGFIRRFTNNPGQFIATMLIGNNIALVVYGLFFSRLLTPYLTGIIGSDIIVLIINTVISTGIILIAGEFLPKTIFKLSPNFFLKSLSLPAVILYYLFYPVSRFTIAASNLFIRMFFGRKNDNRDQENLVFSKLDLDHFVNLNEPVAKDEEPFRSNIQIFKNALDFSNVKVRECMVPRTEIDAVESKSSLSALKERFIETGHSRILIYQDTIDNIIGYFELKDIYKDPPDIMSCVRKVAIVPETMAANKLLKLFFDEKKYVALVVDEFGGTSGIVTIEDVLEEIVGDIEDEHDTNELTEKKLNEKEYVFSGRLEVDYLNDKYNLDLPEEGDYETLAGLILYYHGSIPSVNDVIRIEKFTFRILRVTATRLELVSLKKD